MKVSRAIAAGACLMVGLTMSVGQASTGHTETATYVGGTPYLGTCQGLFGNPVGVAYTCFYPRAGETTVSVTGRDLAGPTAYMWYFRDSQGRYMDGCTGCSGWGCGHATATVPDGAVDLDIHVLDPALGYFACHTYDPNDSGTGINTTGTVTAKFS